MAHYLFSYGTLQQENVQLETFGRTLVGQPDTLMGYEVKDLEITDEAVIKTSGKKIHPISVKVPGSKAELEGTLFEVTDEELTNADKYEVSDYTRVLETFASGKQGWIYTKV